MVGFVAFPVVHVPQNDAEEPVLVLKSWQESIFVVVLCHGLMADFAKAAATMLHEGHTLEQVSRDGVSADTLDVGVQHALGLPAASQHATGGVGECGCHLELALQSCRLDGNLMLDVGNFGCQL